jgi:hypothetical protein
MKKCMLLLVGFCLYTFLHAQADSTVATRQDTLLVSPYSSLQQFAAQAVDRVVVIKWSVAETTEFKSFDIERAEVGGDFHKVGSKLAISQNSDGEYDFVDATPKRNTALRYRLKLISKDGFVTYSDSKETKLADVQWSMRLVQNPVRTNIAIEVDAQVAKQIVVSVVSHAGQQVLSQPFRMVAGKNNFSLPTQAMLPGLYQLVVEAGSDRKTISFIKE